MANINDSPFRGFSWYNTVKQIFESRGIKDEKVWGSIVGVESQGNPKALGDGGKSYGLFQLYTAGGLGDPYKANPTALYDPALNATIAADAMKPVYEAGIKKGLTGFGLAEYVAANAGWPLQTGTLPTDYKVKLMGSYSRYEAPKVLPPNLVAQPASPIPGAVAGGAIGTQTPAVLSVLKTLAEIEAADVSITNPIESGKKLAVMVLLVLLGLVIAAVGLIAFIGMGNTAKIVANVAAPGSGEVLGAAEAAAEAANLKEG